MRKRWKKKEREKNANEFQVKENGCGRNNEHVENER